MTSPEPDTQRALDLVMQMMAIPGKSGEEQAIAEFIRERLLAAGIPPEQIQFDDAHRRTILPGQVGNMIVKLPGTMRGPRRLLAAHLDTVPICVGSQPIRQGPLVASANPATGLGADNRSGCAAILTALLEIAEHQLPHPPLTVCWFVQEEVGLQGSRHLRKSLLGQPKLAFNWDGGPAAKMTVGATGGYRMTIDVSGRASHAGVAPQRGVSAIAIASVAIADLHRGGWHGAVQKGKKQGTSNVGVIAGGEATNVVTDRVQLKAEARSHDPRFRERIIREIERSFQRAAREVRNESRQGGSVHFDGRLDYESFRLDENEPCVLAAQRAIQSVGLEPYRAVTNGGVDANWLHSHGVPTVTLGAGQMSAHMTDERLDVSEFEAGCRIALRLATANEASS
ncbi:MAG: M20/M25/M40 family metallo-hydrolase [Pirellulaceae bacterium]